MIPLAVAWLYFAVPSFSSYSDDSTALCDAYQPTQDLATMYLYGYPITGGGYRLVDSLDVRGREGQLDSMPVPWDGHFYAIASDTAGNRSCASNEAYIGLTTAVEPGDGWPNPPRLLSMRWYDIQGRPTGWPPPSSGVYWQVFDWSNGIRKVRRLVYLK